jgi:hypothetical protein
MMGQQNQKSIGAILCLNLDIVFNLDIIIY